MSQLPTLRSEGTVGRAGTSPCRGRAARRGDGVARRRRRSLARRAERDPIAAEREVGRHEGAFLAALAASGASYPPADGSVEEAALVRTIADVQEVVAGLPERDRLVIQRHYFDGDELKAVAAQLGASYTTARRVHQDALARLAKRLKARGLEAA